MAKNSRKHRKTPKLKIGLPIPRTPPGYKGTGKLLYDLNVISGPGALDDSGIRARIRREYKGQLEVKRIEGKWQVVPKEHDEEKLD